MKYQVQRVRGAQADMVKRLGLVKITASSAEGLFDLGIPLVIAPSKVNDYHFFGGWGLAHRLDSERYLSEGWTFKRMVGNWSNYNENSETGKAAFFVDQKYVASKGEVAADKKATRRPKKRVANPGRRSPSSRSAIRAHVDGRKSIWYIGKDSRGGLSVFKSSKKPTKASHGHRFVSVEGPYTRAEAYDRR